ncbi:MAG: LysR family transcriptional regulator [Alteromonadaceae bacterium]|nr:LysR family transcriptional regulator [Alteromonadaceae bacterium]
MVNFTYKQLRAFVEVAKNGGYATAAENLNITQPALSISIKNLESAIGGNLFVRNTRQTQLTPEGDIFLPTAKRLLRDWEVAYEDVHNLFSLQKGHLSIASMPSFSSNRLPAILASFHQQYPQIKISVLDVVMENVVDQVVQGKADVGFVFRPDQLVNIEFVTLFQNDFIVVCSQNHPLSKVVEVSWTDINNEAMVAMNRGASVRSWVEAEAKVQGANFNIVAEANQLETLGQMVALDLGIAIVPALCLEQMRRKALCCLPMRNSGLLKDVGLIQLQRHNLSSAASAFIEHVKSQKSLFA